MTDVEDVLAGLPTLLTVREAAKVLRLSSAGLRRLLKNGVVPGMHVGHQWRIRKDEVRRIIEEGTRPIELAGGRLAPRVARVPDEQLSFLAGADDVVDEREQDGGRQAPRAGGQRGDDEDNAPPSGGRAMSAGGRLRVPVRIIG